MQLKTFSKRILLIIVLATNALFLLFIINKNDVIPKEIQKGIQEEHVSYGLPVLLKIPSINVNSVINNVGLTELGAMDVPESPKNVAWFELGPRPGENGTSVIAGHYGWKNNTSAVFDNLHKLEKGNKLYVIDDRGDVTTYVVRESRRYDKNADTNDVFFSNDGKSHLNLITCEGAWDKLEKSYPNRLVVFADKEIDI